MPSGLRLSVIALCLCLGTAGFGTPRAWAGSLKGSLLLPEAFEPPPLPHQSGFWQVPNGVLPISPPLVDWRAAMIVVIEGPDLKPKSEVQPVLAIEESRFSPPVLPVRLGVPVVFVNKDKTVHLLEPVGGDFMKEQSIGPGDSFSQDFTKPGEYIVRSSEQPHIAATVVVINRGQATLPEAGGVFRFADIPNGTFTLRVWYRGNWIHKRMVSVQGRTSVDIQLPASAAELKE